MKKSKLHRVGITERQANFELLWTMAWSMAMLVITIVSIFK